MSSVESASRLWRPHPLLGIVVCIAASGLAYLVIDWAHPLVPMEDLPDMGPYPSAEMVARYNAAEYAFQTSNGAINCSILGALVGLLVGLVTSSRRCCGGVVACIAGVLAGAVGGYIAGYFTAGAIIKAAEQSLLQSVGYLSIAWGLIAACVCGVLACIHSKSQILSGIVIGIVVAILGALAYNMVASILFPMSNLVLITPKESGERLVWALSFGTALGLGVGLVFEVPSLWYPTADDKDLVNVA